MQAEILKQRNREKLDDWPNLYFGQGKRAGYAAVTIGGFQNERLFGADDIEKLKQATAGRESCYISLNAFNGRRKASNLKQIRNIGIDLDQYNEGLTIDQAIDALQVLILEGQIPEPNAVYASRGVQLLYTIEGGASPKMEWLTSMITAKLTEKLRHLGADFKATDVARLFRVPGSVNERNGATVQHEMWNDTAYTLDELRCYFPPFDKYRPTKSKAAPVITFPKPVKRLDLFYRTNHARMRDIGTLIRLREGDFTGSRNVLAYIYAYHQSLVLEGLEAVKTAVRKALANVYSRTDKPMTEQEFNKTVKSAYEDSKAFFQAYQANGNRMMYGKEDGIIKPYTTANLIKKLNITEDEQRELGSIRSPKVAKEQDRSRKEQKRRADGVKPMTEYQKTRADKKDDRVARMAELLADKPELTNKQLAELMGVNVRTIQNDKKALPQSN